VIKKSKDSALILSRNYRQLDLLQDFVKVFAFLPFVFGNPMGNKKVKRSDGSTQAAVFDVFQDREPTAQKEELSICCSIGWAMIAFRQLKRCTQNTLVNATIR
jgi:hypothetical protein